MIIGLGSSPGQSRQINHLLTGRSFGEGQRVRSPSRLIRAPHNSPPSLSTRDDAELHLRIDQPSGHNPPPVSLRWPLESSKGVSSRSRVTSIRVMSLEETAVYYLVSPSRLLHTLTSGID